MRPLSYVCLLFFGMPAAHAGFILDDFNDPGQVTSPDVINEFVNETGVGPFNATRGLRVNGFGADPIATFDSNVTAASILTGEFDGLVPESIVGVFALGFSTLYTLDEPIDFTEGGSNDAILIDVSSFKGPGIPSFLRVSVIDGNGQVFQAARNGFNLRSDDPYTAEFPFEVFGSRGGGGIGQADFTSIDWFGVTVNVSSGFSDPNQQWSVEFDRFRVGNAVPEPAACTLLLCGAVVFGISWRNPRPPYKTDRQYDASA
jgi:hypothetical protein